uniref:Uncharacterized protein n=1 Tax=Nelumbo nucifera TaxID=4432 RepID=A0A822YBS5_NELNU|nr:TPA_asm: hypothetical protein HUJ06_028436 [Nelumbo nucifera]
MDKIFPLKKKIPFKRMPTFFFLSTFIVMFYFTFDKNIFISRKW